MLITGPNMSGKSTYMRMIALIIILAQAGLYVPAKKVKMPIYDGIFTRIGASDDISSGKSTFMMEMLETNEALRKSTSKSLLILMKLEEAQLRMMVWLLLKGLSNTLMKL